MARGRHLAQFVATAAIVAACSSSGDDAGPITTTPAGTTVTGSSNTAATVAAPSTAATTTATTATTTTSVPAPPSTYPLPEGLRWCDYVPGAPVASEHVDIVDPASTPQLPPITEGVDAEVTALHVETVDALGEAVRDQYVDPEFNGKDWDEIVQRYRDYASVGLTDEDFGALLELMVFELGDGHSNVETAQEAKQADELLAGQVDFVGIGVLAKPILDGDGASIIAVLPDSPAAAAGLRPHDTISLVDGVSILPDPGKVWVNPLLGPEGTTLAITVTTPGSEPRELQLVRARVTSGVPIEVCLVPGTRVAFAVIPGLFDATFATQLDAALRAAASDAPLEGLVIDNRMNGGGSSKVLEPLLALFTNGDLGEYHHGDEVRSLSVEGVDAGGSQALPLAVLVGSQTVSYGEVMSGLLQSEDEAIVIGQTTNGNVETLHSFDLPDGSKLWLATETFTAAHQTYGPWEDTGIHPDIDVPTRWDLYREANDPALAAAVAALTA